MSQSVPQPVWIIERRVAKGIVRIGVVGRGFAAELNGRRVPLGHGDIVAAADIAASRHTAHLFPALRDGGYTHLLGGAIALLPGEAKTLKDVAMGTAEGLAIHRAKLLEALRKEEDDEPPEEVITGLAVHGDERAARVTPARQALMEFDRRHPSERGKG